MAIALAFALVAERRRMHALRDQVWNRPRALVFRPDDRLWDIHRTDQVGQLVDTCQLEELQRLLVDDYAADIDLSDPDLTLGQLFAATKP